VSVTARLDDMGAIVKQISRLKQTKPFVDGILQRVAAIDER
jgi:hypothetical protein